MNKQIVWEMNTPHQDLKLQGFSGCEPWGRWVDGGTASIKFPINFYPSLLKIQIRSFTPKPESEVFCDIYINNILIDSWRENGQGIKIKNRFLILEKSYIDNSGYIDINFFIKGNSIPKEYISNSNDSRKLGIGFEKIEISNIDNASIINLINETKNETIEIIDDIFNSKIENFLNNLTPELRLNLFRDSDPGKISKDYFYWQNRQNNAALKIKNKIKNKKRINVAFLVNMFSTFPYESVYFEMLNNELFNPFILAVPFIPQGNNIQRNKSIKNEILKNKEKYKQVISVLDENDEIIDYRNDIDIIFVPSGALHNQPKPYQIFDFLDRDIPIAYVCYGFLIQKAGNHENSVHSNLIWKNYVETNFHLNQFIKFQKIKGKNSVLVGYPKMDGLAKLKKSEKANKRIIIAPHHSMHGIGFCGQFLKYYKILSELPNKYPSIEFIYRPHPLFNQAIKRFWDEKQISEYWNNILKSSNAKIDQESNYLQSFLDSDALIHDCGSFLPEYFYTGSPQCYLLKDKKSIEEYFNDLGKECLNHSYLAFEEEDITNFIENVVINSKDGMKETRKSFSENILMTNFPNSSKIIINDIIKSINS